MRAHERCKEDGMGCFVTETGAGALEKACLASQERYDRGAALSCLDGVPMAFKDAYMTAGVRTTAGSRVLGQFEPSFSATVVERMEAGGCVSLGKTLQDEFSMGSTGQYVPEELGSAPRNPRSAAHAPAVAGGSSSGSAVAVATGVADYAFGTDTGGSVRLPAAFCGVVGYKPSYGRVSRWGVVAFASSLDVPSVIACDVATAAAAVEIVGGEDSRDATSLAGPGPRLVEGVQGADGSVRGLVVGVPDEYAVEELHPAALAAWEDAAARLRAGGADVRRVSLPHTPYALPVYYIISAAEASSNLARYDGVRYGLASSDDVSSVHDMLADVRSHGFGPEVQRRVLLGTYVLSSDQQDVYFTRAQRVRRLIASELFSALRDVDVLLTPTAVGPAPPMRSDVPPVDLYANDVMTIPSSLAGLPAISIPASTDPRTKLPLAVQLIGRPLQDSNLLAISKSLESLLV